MSLHGFGSGTCNVARDGYKTKGEEVHVVIDGGGGVVVATAYQLQGDIASELPPLFLMRTYCELLQLGWQKELLRRFLKRLYIIVNGKKKERKFYSALLLYSPLRTA